MSNSKKPSHIAYVTREFGDNGKTSTRYFEIGAVWPHKDGKGFNLVLDAIPVGGKIVIRANEPKAAQADNAAEG